MCLPLPQDSNQFHAVCLDTYPPIMYLSDVSKRIMQLVTEYNKLYGEEKVRREERGGGGGGGRRKKGREGGRR